MASGQHLEIDASGGIIELARRSILAALFSLRAVIGIDILDAPSLYNRSHLYFVSHRRAQKVASASVS